MCAPTMVRSWAHPRAVLLPDTANRRCALPPSMSPLTPAEAFDAVPREARFDAFINNDDFFVRGSLSCAICLGFLDEPVVCQAGCSFLACLGCWREQAEPDKCAHCRTIQEHPPQVAKHLLPILREELETQNAAFQCNLFPPNSGKHACGLWCCDQTFGSLQELRAHLARKPPFGQQRASVRALLSRACDGAKEAQSELFDNPYRRELTRTVLEEDQSWRWSMPKLCVNARERSRSPRLRHWL